MDLGLWLWLGLGFDIRIKYVGLRTSLAVLRPKCCGKTSQLLSFAHLYFAHKYIISLYRSTTCFSTDDASGSTSQAANIMEVTRESDINMITNHLQAKRRSSILCILGLVSIWDWHVVHH